MSFDTVALALLVPFVSALAAMAYRHPDNYKAASTALVYVLLFVVLGIMVYNAGVLTGYTSASDKATMQKVFLTFDDLPKIQDRYTFSILILSAYIWLLTHLPKVGLVAPPRN